MLTAALRPMTGADASVTGASRTDAGVHALGQVASVAGGRPLRPATVLAALNATLPRDVRIVAARVVPGTFDARRSARLKRYRYLVDRGAVASPFWGRYAWHVGRDVDVAAMRRALGALRGRHDFSAFCAAPGRDRDPVCTLTSVRVVERRSLVGIFVSADAFLHHMVRNLVGSALEVGLGRRGPEWMGALLEERDRRRAGPTAPAQGLCLLSVRYPAALFPGGGRRPALRTPG